MDEPGFPGCPNWALLPTAGQEVLPLTLRHSTVMCRFGRSCLIKVRLRSAGRVRLRSLAEQILLEEPWVAKES